MVSHKELPTSALLAPHLRFTNVPLGSWQVQLPRKNSHWGHWDHHHHHHHHHHHLQTKLLSWILKSFSLNHWIFWDPTRSPAFFFGSYRIQRLDGAERHRISEKIHGFFDVFYHDFKAYVREYPQKIWPYMVQYLQFRILEFPLKIAVLQFYIGIPVYRWCEYNIATSCSNTAISV